MSCYVPLPQSWQLGHEGVGKTQCPATFPLPQSWQLGHEGVGRLSAGVCPISQDQANPTIATMIQEHKWRQQQPVPSDYTVLLPRPSLISGGDGANTRQQQKRFRTQEAMATSGSRGMSEIENSLVTKR